MAKYIADIRVNTKSRSGRMSKFSTSAREDASLLLYSFYKTKNPEKLDSISTILERYEGREGLLYANLMEKYEITTQQLLEEFPELKEAHIRFTELLETEKAQESVLGVSDEGGRERVMSNSSNARADVLTDLKSSVNILGNQIPTFEGLKEYNTDFLGKLPPMEGWQEVGTGLMSSLSSATANYDINSMVGRRTSTRDDDLSPVPKDNKDEDKKTEQDEDEKRKRDYEGLPLVESLDESHDEKKGGAVIVDFLDLPPVTMLPRTEEEKLRGEHSSPESGSGSGSESVSVSESELRSAMPKVEEVGSPKGGNALFPVNESAIGVLLDLDSGVKAEKRQEEDKGNVLETQSNPLEDSLASQQPSRLQQHAEAIISDLEQEVQGLVVALTSTQKKLVNAEDKLAKQDERLEKEKQEREKERTEFAKERKITKNRLQQLECGQGKSREIASSSCSISSTLSENSELNEAHARKDESETLAASVVQNALPYLSSAASSVANAARQNSLGSQMLKAGEVKLDRGSGSKGDRVTDGEAERELRRLQQELDTARLHIKDLSEQRDNKHKQLVEVIQMNHTMGAQVRFLASRAFQCYVVQERQKRSSQEQFANEEDFVLPDVSALSKAVLDKAEYAVKTRLHNASSLENVVVEPQEGSDEGDLAAKVASLSMALDIVHSSWVAGRVELKHALREAATAEVRAEELQRDLDRLQEIVSLPAELSVLGGTPSKSSRNGDKTKSDREHEEVRAQLCALLEQARRDHELTEEERRRAADKAIKLDRENISLRQEVTRLQDNVAATQASKADLVSIARKQTQEAETRAYEIAKSLTEKCLREREEMLSRARTEEELRARLKDIQVAVENEEVHRLRQDLLDSRRKTGEKAQEVEFLQAQLIEAAAYITELSEKSAL